RGKGITPLIVCERVALAAAPATVRRRPVGGFLGGPSLGGRRSLFGRINDDIQRRRATQFDVDLSHALITFRTFPEVIDETNLHRQLTGTPANQANQYRGGNRRQVDPALGEVGGAVGEGLSQIIEVAGAPVWQQLFQ